MNFSIIMPKGISEADSFSDDFDYDEGDIPVGADIHTLLENLSLSDASGGDVMAIVDTQTEDQSKELQERTPDMVEADKIIKEVKLELRSLMRKPRIKSQLNPSIQTVLDSDNRSVYVGNVDYGTTKTELEEHFSSCGPIIRVTIVCDHFSGHPKGYAYVEYKYSDSCKLAKALNDTLFRGRQIKVSAKRIYLRPNGQTGISTTDQVSRGRFFRGASSAGCIRGVGSGSFQAARDSRPQGSTWSCTFRGSTWSSRPQRTTRLTPY